MGMVNVPRAELARLVGVSPDVDDLTLQQAIDSKLAQNEAEKHAHAVSAAEQRARADDRRIVIAAYNEGRIPQSRIDFWCEAMQRDRAGNRAILAALAPGLAPPEKLPTDPQIEHVHAKVLARMGIRPPASAPTSQTVAASSPPPSPGVDDLGIPIAPLPPPVRIVHGKDPATWSKEERDNALLYGLGPRFAAAAAARGIPRPPGGSGYYQPTGIEPYEPVDLGGGQIEWRAKPDYRPRGD
ncbi:hypothetical protein PICSAR240_03912 [Mycobacterium avium subsp. paratuberculosis]|nr:hypothetical protein [Mycobacterium avium]OUZ02914.1 hypothetical protein B0172_02959 [Mycobacterium avium subsp. paratuberculosis]OVF05707.1 hypothetical protein B0173_00422 [Mycobacterium avium subsp. paratuberculosis]QKU44523.1 hypothetical protein MAP44135_1075 [Mycobacterium avium subsp. paratuberculosis]UKO60658.1 hypothetical protein KYH25_05325 [Mycobacterium avium subsp. paratuberculosis]UKO64957.1 hypothetical protein KYF43_05330 [Mycobacterium avium subsp. paratuberculosis]